MGLIPFNFDGTPMRTIIRDGEPWFVLADVCGVLEISNSRDAANRLDPDENADVGITDGDNINGLGGGGAMPTGAHRGHMAGMTR